MGHLKGFLCPQTQRADNTAWHVDFHFGLSSVICDLSFLRHLGEKSDNFTASLSLFKKTQFAGFSTFMS